MPGKLLAAGLAALTTSLLIAGTAFAAPAVDGEFPLPAGETVGSNNEIVQGPDGNMWVTTDDATNSVVRITPDGTAETFLVPNTPIGITVGPDNNLWVSTPVGVVEIPPDNPAGFTAYNGIGLNNGHGIAAGPDGNMWVAGDDKLIRFSPADPDGTAAATTITGMSAKGMDVGSDGLLWIAGGGSGKVFSATAADAPDVDEYIVDGAPQDVAGGPGGQVGYANPIDDPHEVGLITPGGLPQQIPLETSDPFGIAFGQDGAYWIARSSTDDLLRLAPDGSITNLTGFSNAANVGPRKVATGPDNTLWVTLDDQEAVGRVTGVEPPTTAFDTEITKGPKKKVKTKKKRAKVKFKFTSDAAGATFECKLKKPKKKGARFKPCESPRKYKLKRGKYKFQVRAVLGDAVDATPAKQKFKVVRKK